YLLLLSHHAPSLLYTLSLHDALPIFARQSFPVATTTASTPFIIPLLWVAQRNGSASAKAYASRMPSTTSSPERSSVLRTAFAKRSEEHTSELQSRVDLVCRLLLEKKK